MMPQTEGNLFALVPLLLFMALMLAIGVWVRRGRGFGEDFVQQYFIGNRRLGGFVLAMTTVATYSSVSSFVGGPGMAWKVGFGWIYMAVVQVTAIFLVLGIFGKRVAMLSRRFDAVTVVDIIRERFESNGLAMLAALVIVLFFCGTMTAQFVGGARLFAAATGYSYEMGLLLFGLVVVLYTSIGGFRAVALTDTCCALMMMVGIVVLLYYVLAAGGGYQAILSGLHAEHPELFEPLSAGKMPLGLYFTQWLLVGICTIALPQSVVRGISYKDTHSLHRAMLIGTVVVGFMNIGVNFTGILAHGVLDGPEASYGSVDNIIPLTIARAVPPELVGLAIIGPLAASISTISGLLIVASSAIVKDVYLAHMRAKGRTVKAVHLSRLSVVTTAALGVLVFALALTPPSLIWIINMFAFGGLETAFFWMLLLGLYWRGANRLGALLSMAGGTVAYCAAQAAGFKIMGLHQITIGITVSLVLFLLGARLGRPTSAAVLQVFFPGRGERKKAEASVPIA
ncbi:sodium/pantothenate symporter [Selenomonas bovis]|uniref:Sodium/pantothenate symporter n=1 Tax=Selenomonas bovis TaxID=416586 RepID=A0A848BFL7_9FIRM|nr:sodium/pantothenate symporter [Selenomonas bovis]NMD99801.1 sodium/pantothenate symporter [Selenomonas bovis]